MDVAILKQLIEDVEHGKPDMPDEILHLTGYSSPKVRRLLNALCSQPDANYLEIGVHLGSTFIPAVYGNGARATCIDNWEMFHSRPGFDENVKRYIPNREINALEADCFEVDLALIPDGVTAYFYDGSHTTDAQCRGITRFLPVMADRFVLLVDDFNYAEPRNGTAQAIQESSCTVLYETHLLGAYDGDQDGWWNGLYVALIEKAAIA